MVAFGLPAPPLNFRAFLEWKVPPLPPLNLVISLTFFSRLPFTSLPQELQVVQKWNIGDITPLWCEICIFQRYKLRDILTRYKTSNATSNHFSILTRIVVKLITENKKIILEVNRMPQWDFSMRIRGQTNAGRQIDGKTCLARDTLNTFTELTETYERHIESVIAKSRRLKYIQKCI